MTAIVHEPRVALDLSALTGTWENTNAASRGVVRLDIAAEGGALRISANDWGATAAHTYSADGFESRQALAFNGTFTLRDRDVRLQANIKAGVLVIAFLTRFHDEPDETPVAMRSNFFAREFYYRSSK
jgi:hypothetical protein